MSINTLVLVSQHSRAISITELSVNSQNIKVPVSVVVEVLLMVPNEGQISVVVGGASVIKVLLVNIELIFTQIIIYSYARSL